MSSAPKVLVIFSHRPPHVITWPRAGYDYEMKKREILEKLNKYCPKIIFDSVTACDVEESVRLLERAKEYDGIVLYQLGFTCPTSLLFAEKCDKPMILVDEIFFGSGTFALALGWSKKMNLPVVGIASSKFEDVANKVRLISVIKRLQGSRIILITRRDEERPSDQRSKLLYESTKYGGAGKSYDIDEQIARLKKLFGVEVVRLDYADIEKYFDEASEERSEEIADSWIKSALRVVEPNRDDIVASARMYLALKKMIKDYNADGITIDCYRKFHELPAYPCMAFFQLNNEGITAVCEADLSSALTQLLLRYLTEEMAGELRPGFVNDPAADFSKNWIIYCHCTASNRAFGPNGEPNPFVIRSHAESGKGVAVQSLMPLGEVVTAVQIHFMRDPPLLVIHQGKAVAHIDREEGCRTKLAVETDAKRIFSNWNRRGGWILPAHWHRVVVYGDWREHLKDLATLMRMEIFEEDK